MASEAIANYADLNDILTSQTKEKIGRAKYIEEKDLSEFDGIFTAMKMELKAIAKGDNDDV